ncbi:MAG: hypothetical protein IPK09_05275 [Candidatus Competibacteraceae bacterium]|nr:hypothetical protein [Candidatus Competibacteraceae bacterium]
MRYSFFNPVLRWLVLLLSYTLVLFIRLLKWLVAPLALLPQLLIGVPAGLLRIKLPLRPRFTSVREPDLPDAAWIAFTDVADALAAAGFVTQSDFRCDELICNGVLWLRFLKHPDLETGALAAYAAIDIPVRPGRQFVEFSTDFHDGRLLVTTNLNLPYSLPAPAYLARIQLKDIWEPRALYALHRDLVERLPQAAAPKTEGASRDPANLLTERCNREIQALIKQGWLRLDPRGDSARLRPWAALTSAWRQAWPLQSLYLWAADRRSRQLLAKNGLDVAKFAGGAPSIEVFRQPLTAVTTIDGARAGYEYVWPLAQQTDGRAVLESVVVEFDVSAISPFPREFRYSFKSHADHAQRRIRRYCSFDILLDPMAGTLAATATEREFEQAADDSEWQELTATAPLAPLRFDPWLRDLDSVLPTAQTALARGANGKKLAPDSASLYLEGGRPFWQIVAWADDDTPLFVILDARSGIIVKR